MQPTSSSSRGFALSSNPSVAALTALVMAGGASASRAADSDKDAPVALPELSVQAQKNQALASPKFTAPLVDTPQTVAIIPSSLFNQQGAQNLTEVLRNTPGITFNAGENGFASGMSNFSLRGFDTSGSIFIDGTRDSGNYNRDVFNLEQVEVVKGPAGDNGRGSAGGYVNLSTKTPRAENFQRATLSYGFDEYDSSDRTRATVDINQQVSGGTAVRLNALWQDGGVPGRAVAEKNGWGVAPSVAFGLDGPTRLVVSYQHTEQNDLPDWGVPGALIEGMIQYNAGSGGEANRDRFYGHVSDYDDVTADALLARIEHDFSPALRISNQTRWSQTEREALYALPTGYTPATRVAMTQRQGYSRENTAISNLTNLSAAFDTGSLRHTLAAGLEFSREESSANGYRTNNELGNPGTTPIDNPNPRRPLTGLIGLVPVQTSEVEINTIAAYAYDTVQINPQWQLTGGLRAESYKVELANKNVAGAPQGPDGYDRSDTTLSGKVGVVYKPNANGSVYAAVGVAALPPGSYLSNPDISRDNENAFPGWRAGQNSATSKVQRSTNYEIGTKWNLFDKRLTTSAALFRTERENIAMAGTVNGVANTLVEYGEQVIQGLELSASGQVTPAWSVFGGVLFMDSERKHSPAVDAARIAADAGSDYGAWTTTNGHELAFTPKVTANFWTTYRLPIGLTLGGGIQYVGDSYLGRPDDAERIIPNGKFGKLPSYTVLNAVAAYEVNRNLTLRLNIDNVTDEFYAASSNWNGSRVSLGAARSFLLSAEVSF
jgi:catecholate siderophore receptor